MSCPLEFITTFRRRLREAGVCFALTSGQACVYYGIQQTTKDSDWIVAPEDLERLREMLGRRHRLPEKPFDESARCAALARALAEVTDIFGATSAELDRIVPPQEVLLP